MPTRELRRTAREVIERIMQRSGILLKSEREIELMERAGRLVYDVLAAVGRMAAPGVTTCAMNARAEEMIAEAGAKPLFKGVTNPEARFPFPAALCTSTNAQVVHGLPDDKPLVEGDIVSVDCGVQLAGYCGDSAVTLPVGRISDRARHLLDVTLGALNLAIREIQPGRRWSEVAQQIQAYVEGEGMSVVRDFVGHGIGRAMHEEPKVPNYYDRSRRDMDFELVPRMVIAVEPMVNLGTSKVCYADGDRWIVRTQDGSLAAHFEHTIAVDEEGCRVLTRGG